jgi:lactoylglutathione lyase
MEAKGFSHIYLPSRSVDESIEFYTKKLGFKLQRKYSMNGRVSAYVEIGGVLLELTQGENTPDQDGRTEPRIGIEVSDIAAAIEELRSAGVEIAREPWAAMTFWGTQAMIKDPSGYIISLREWRAPDGPNFPDWKPEHDTVERLA